MTKQKKKLYKIYYSLKPNLQIPILWTGTRITENGYEVPDNKKALLNVCNLRNYSKPEIKRFVERNIADIDGVERRVQYLLPIKKEHLRYQGPKGWQAPKAVKAFVEAVTLETDNDDQFLETEILGEKVYKTNYSTIVMQVVEYPDRYSFDLDEILGEVSEDEKIEEPKESLDDGVMRPIGKKIGRKPVSKRKEQDKLIRLGKVSVAVAKPLSAKKAPKKTINLNEDKELEGELI